MVGDIGGVRFQSMGGLKKSEVPEYSCRGNCKRRRREAAIAEGKKPLTTRGSGERRIRSPSGVWGGAPETDAILNNFLAKWSTFWALVNLIFCNNQIEKRRLNLILNNYMKKF